MPSHLLSGHGTHFAGTERLARNVRYPFPCLMESVAQAGANFHIKLIPNEIELMANNLSNNPSIKKIIIICFFYPGSVYVTFNCKNNCAFIFEFHDTDMNTKTFSEFAQTSFEKRQADTCQFQECFVQIRKLLQTRRKD